MRKLCNILFTLSIFLILLFSIIGCTNQAKYDECKTGDYQEERDCYTALAYNKVDSKICENMPDDVNERQANKAFCLGFIASTTGDLQICRNQKTVYYKNSCKIIYERYFMGSDPEFEELKNIYHLK